MPMVGAAAAARAARTNPEPPEAASLSVVRQRKETTTHPAGSLARPFIAALPWPVLPSLFPPSLLCPAKSGRFAHGLRKKKSLKTRTSHGGRV